MRRAASLLVSVFFALSSHASSRDEAEIVDDAIRDGKAITWVEELVDAAGARAAGSEGARRAVDWAVAAFARAGIAAVSREPVDVDAWIRGEEVVELIAPRHARLAAIGLGGTEPTGQGGVEADVIAVDLPKDVAALGDKVKGKIVLYTHETQRARDGRGYGEGVVLRYAGAVEAARHGAVAALIRSVGTGMHRLPHTGAMRYDAAVPRIPVAALASEDVLAVERRLKRGEKVRIRMKLASRREKVVSHNVVAELKGATKPDEIVLIGAHLDSWDVGEGALDDGAGCAMVLETMRLLSKGKPPARTVRAVLFMNEEHGLSGAKAYAERHKSELEKHIGAIESDIGAGKPIGFAFSAGGQVPASLLRRFDALSRFSLAPMVAAQHYGADLIPLAQAGVPALSFLLDSSDYFDWHHTAGDTVDKIDPRMLALDAGLFAYAVRALASDDAILTRVAPAPAGSAPRR